MTSARSSDRCHVMKESAEKINVLCVDDNAHVADALRIKFSMGDEFTWAGWLPDAREMIDTVERQRPSIVILDIDMPGLDPFEAVVALAQRCPECRVVFFSGHVRRDLIDRGIEAGAWGYVSKNDGEESLVDAIKRINEGEFVLSPEVRTIYDR